MPARAAQLDHAAPFLGDLNPESVFVEATMTEISRVTPVETQGDARVGFWGTIDRDANTKEATDLPLGHDLSHKPHLAFYTDNGDKRCVAVTDPVRFANYASEILVDELAALVRPSESQWDALRALYSKRIHPIFPIFDEACLRDLAQEPPRIAELIKASVCLAAASDWDAAKHLFLNLNLPGSQERHRKLVPYGEYSKTVISFIKETTTILEAKTSRDMISKLRIMTLTCMYWQPEPSARSEPLVYYAVLASTVHTYGYHLKAMADTNQPDAEAADRGEVSRLFKCIYSLDRLLSCFWARPVMFHNYDLLMTPSPQSKSESPSFKLFWSIIELLDQVIGLYRPHAAQEEVHHINVPVLERLILEAGAESVVPDGVLASLEILYHAVCVTSVRMPRDRFKTSPQMDEGGDLSYRHLPPSILNARRSHSADRIFDITRDRSRYKLSPMPFIPYALSLSLTVAYRKWKFSRTGMFRVRGFEDFARTLAVLRGYGKIWTSARINSNLGNLVMDRLDRVKQLEAESRSKQATTSAARPGSKARRGLQPDQRPSDDVPMPRIENETSVPATGDALPRVADTSLTEAPGLETAWIDVTGDSIGQQQHQAGSASPSLTRTPAPSNAYTTDLNPFSPYPPPSYLGDLPFLTGTGEDATFESWDMADSVDNFFGSNLDLGNPLFWPGYAIDGGS